MEYVISVLVLMGIYVILSTSFNLIIGYGGLISIAHPIFFALGAYTTGVLSIHSSISPFLCILLGAFLALVFSLLLSLPSLRISGDYLLITSIGFQLGLLEVIKHLGLTGGASGLGNIPNIIEFGDRSSVFALISIAMAILVFLFIRWLLEGPYGLLITAMRDDELVFKSLGRNAMKVKLVIFAIGSAFAGLAGGLYAYYYQYVNPDQFEILQSSMILTMVVVGGMGSQWGPVVGAVLLLFLPQAIGFLNFPPSVMAPLQGLLYSLLVIIFLFVRPQGLMAAKRNNELKGLQ
jgi:branched-chain amino acid transport system permease protein